VLREPETSFRGCTANVESGEAGMVERVESLPVIRRVKPVQENIREGDVILTLEVETDNGPRLLRLSSTAASQLKALLETPVTSMRFGGQFQ